MKNDIQITIIIPCYNAEKFIGSCLDSLYYQNVSEDYYEIICVNDFSTDNTTQIIEQYQKNHSNLKLINLPCNKKQGAARNEGLKAAKGEFVWFVDADDLVVENIFQDIFKELAENQLDILQFNIDVTNPLIYPAIYETNVSEDSKIQTGVEYLKYLMHTTWGRTIEVWRRLFNRKFLLDNNLFFPEYVFGTEDMLFFYQTMIRCDRIKLLSKTAYIYRIDNALSVTNFKKGVGLKLADKIIANLDIISYFSNIAKIQDNDLKSWAIDSYRWSLHKYIPKIYVLEKEELKHYLSKISKYSSFVAKNSKKYETFLITNSIFIKSINTIFVPVKKVRNLFKKNV